MIHSKNGIFVLQCIALWISSIFAYVICKQFISNRYIALVGVISFWVCFALVIDEGGLCEEFNLPVLMISTYLIIRFSNSKFDEHPPRYAFVHGITVAASFCFRATNCIAICGAVFIIEASNPVPPPLLGHRCRSSQEITSSPTPFSTSNHYLWICASASFSLSNPNIAA